MKQKQTMAVLIVTLAMILLVPVSAAGKFTDVPTTHWAHDSITEMANGGLIAGYGGGKYGPNDNFNIDQMATIICRAKGYDAKASGGYWAYGAVDYCINNLYCLPSHGSVSAANYSVPCTRELAYYMLWNGLGSGGSAYVKQFLGTDLPDFSSIASDYRESILKCYSFGLTVGVDKEGTFDPKALLNRAQAATMFVRAGFTKAAELPTTVPAGTLSNQQIYDKIKALGVWTESKTYDGNKVLKATAAKHGGISVELRSFCISVDAPERNKSAWFNAAGNYVDVNGKVVNDAYDANGKMICSAGFSYEARQLLAKILKIAVPNEYDEAYAAMKATFRSEVYEYPTINEPSAVRWLDGRAISMVMGADSHIFGFGIFEQGDSAVYDEMKAGNRTKTPKKYSFATTGFEEGMKAYELDRW